MDDESQYQEFDNPLASDGSDFEENAIVGVNDLFSDDDSVFSLISVENSELQDIRRGWNDRAMALETNESIIIDAENDVNFQENEGFWDDDNEDETKPPNGKSIAHKHILKIG